MSIMVHNKLRLPLDVLLNVLALLPVSSSAKGDPAISTLVAFQFANSLLRDAALSPQLWGKHYKAHYPNAVKAKEVERQRACATPKPNWRKLYIERRCLDNHGLDLLHGIITNPECRRQKTEDLMDLSFDVWDAISSIAERPGNRYPEHGDDTLTRQYWAKEVLIGIATIHACQRWTLLRDDSNALSFEETMTLLSCFFGKSPFQITQRLDRLSAACRAYLKEESVVVDKRHPTYNIHSVCSGILTFMHTRGFGPLNGREVHYLHQFPHAYLTTHKNATPIALAHVFVAIATRLGLRARPTTFSTDMALVRVHSGNGAPSDCIVSVCGAPNETNVRTLEEEIVGSSARQFRTCASGFMLSKAVEGLLHILLETLSLLTWPPSTTTACSLRASLSGVTILRPSPSEPIRRIRKTFPPSFMDDVVTSRIPLLSLPTSTISRSPSSAVKVQPREGPVNPAYFVGAICNQDDPITGENSICSVVGWTVLSDAKTVSYKVIARGDFMTTQNESSIQLCSPSSEEISSLFDKFPSLPMHFTGCEIVRGRSRLIPSPEMRLRYPDDNRVGAEWIRSGRLSETVARRSSSR